MNYKHELHDILVFTIASEYVREGPGRPKRTPISQPVIPSEPTLNSAEQRSLEGEYLLTTSASLSVTDFLACDEQKVCIRPIVVGQRSR